MNLSKSREEYTRNITASGWSTNKARQLTSPDKINYNTKIKTVTVNSFKITVTVLYINTFLANATDRDL